LESTEGSSGGRALHRQDPPIRIFRRVRLAQHIEGLLKIAVVHERAPIACKQHLVAGIGDARLLEHGNRLRPLTGGAQRLGVVQREVGVLWVGAVAIAISVHLAPRIGRLA
jgi:hypothetical protein